MDNQNSKVENGAIQAVDNKKPRKPFYRRVWFWILAIIVLLFTWFEVSREISYARRQNERKQATANAEELLAGKVKVPETLFETQEAVEAKFKAAGLEVEFVVSNFDDKAIANERFLRKGECDKLDTAQPAIAYFDSDVVGDKYGYYADIGATIIVGHSDHDFDGAGNSEAEVAETPTPEPTTEPTKEPTTEPTAETTKEPTTEKKVIVLDSQENLQEWKSQYLENAEMAEWYDGGIVVYTKELGVLFSVRNAVYREIRQVINAVQNNDYSSVTSLTIDVRGMVIDAYGNEELDTVVVCSFSKDAIDKINLGNLNDDNIPIIADTWVENVNIDK